MIIGFEIKASANFINPSFELELIALRELADMRREIVVVEWQIMGLNEDDYTFNNNKLCLGIHVQGLEQVIISATEVSTGLVVQREFQVVYSTAKLDPVVHFIKNDQAYAGHDFIWELWSYSDDCEAVTVNFSLNSDFGVMATVSSQYIIVRKRTWGEVCNDWSEQSITFELNPNQNNYYIVYETNKIYTSLTDVVANAQPRIEYACMDTADKVTVYLSHVPLIDTVFELYLNAVKQENVCVNILHHAKQVTFTSLPLEIQSSDLLVIKSSLTFPPFKVHFREYLNKFYYSGNDMGVVFNAANISLRLWAPTAVKVELLLYHMWVNQPEIPSRSFTLNSESISGTHFIQINRYDCEHLYYLYRLTFLDVDENGNQMFKTTYAVDPYANGLSINGECGVLIDLTSPEAIPIGWHNDKKPILVAKEDAIIFELHVRDFTISPQSGIKEQLRGKFLGVVEAGCSYTDESGTRINTGIDSLVEMGITHVHLLPIFDFASVDETKLGVTSNRNWGYDPHHYNVPDGSYATDPHNPYLRIRETRQMIHGLHNNGIRVVMDVVYNHMFSTANMDNIVPGYYFRSDDHGHYTNGSGCGNELATERPMVSKFILDSINHWIHNYKIDGLRIDLMELMDLDTMKQLVKQTQSIDSSFLVYGEPWKGGETPLVNRTYRGSQQNQGFAIFNDLFRDAIRGNNSPGHGFINGNSHHALNCKHVMEGLRGSITSLAAQPGESINYVDAHDNYTLWDHIEKSQYPCIMAGDYRHNIPANPLENFLVRQNLLALGLVLTAQGIPFMHGGATMLRTKQGDHNSYKSNDQINAFHWQDKARFKSVFNYIKGLIELRKAHPAFRMSERKMIEEHMHVYPAHYDDHSGVIITHLKNHANGDSWRDIVVVYNATTIENYPVNHLIPQIENVIWHIVANHERAGNITLFECMPGNLPALRSHSMLVIHS